MDLIQEPNSKFQIEKLVLTTPNSVTGGNHFIKYLFSDSPLYIQTPKCKVKQGIIKSGKRMYFDLIFTNENEEFVQWLENLENYSQKYIFSKREKWFNSTLEEHDIENLFSSVLKSVKMGKFYILRVNIPQILPNLKIYDENETIMGLDDIKPDINIISILEFQGIKCSARGFQIEIEAKQILLLKPTDIFEKCILSKTGKFEKPILSDEAIMPNNILDNKMDVCLVSNGSIMSNDVSGCNQLAISSPGTTLLRSCAPGSNLEDGEIIRIPEDKSLLIDNNSNLDSLECEINTKMNDLEPVSNLRMSRVDQMSEDVEDRVLPDKSSETFDLSPKNKATDDNLFTDNVINEQNSLGRIIDIKKSDSNLLEIDLHLEEIQPDDSVILKNRNEVYYEMYKEALKKAKMAKDLALSSYLEAKRIKNLYMLDDLNDDSELEEYLSNQD